MASVLLRIEKIILQHVTELVDSLGVSCLQVFNGIIIVHIVSPFLPPSTFFAKEEAKF